VENGAVVGKAEAVTVKLASRSERRVIECLSQFAWARSVRSGEALISPRERQQLSNVFQLDVAFAIEGHRV
jgi:hypothetical protein